MDKFMSSKLGTKEYWDSTYERELDCFQDTKDIGEIWFGHDSVDRLVDCLDSNDVITTDSSVLDIGCGNGYTLIALAEKGYTNLTGIDYSDKAVQLALSVAHENQFNIQYEVCDVLATAPFTNEAMCRQYDVCLDKGTFDAISLCPDNTDAKKQKYMENVLAMLKENGLFIVTSCNWTHGELLEQFGKGFQFLENIPAPTFTFGGVKGSRETVAIFKKR